MSKRPKNQPAKANGRPPLPQLSERQSVMRRELLNVVKPYFKAALKEIAKIGGLKVDEETQSLDIQDDDKSKKEQVGASTRLSACKTITDMYQNSLKEVYLKDDSTPASKNEDDDTPPVRTTGTVSKLSLHVVEPS